MKLTSLLGIGLAAGLVSSHFVGRAQTPSSGMGPGLPETKQACLLPSEHEQISQSIRQKLTLLNSTRPTARRLATRPVFRWPLQSTKPTSAFNVSIISNYVDHSLVAGPDEVNQYSVYNKDYACGNKTYNLKTGYRHTGTDIALYPFDWNLMQDEVVSVVAAAPGIIVLKADGNNDQTCGSFTDNRQWNAIYVRHDDGSVAWYGHLKRGSLTQRREGDRVDEGDFLGYVGSSGRSSGPHLHFEVYDANNRLIDPFSGPCNATAKDSWWREQSGYGAKVINRNSLHLTPPVQFVCPPSANKPNEVAFVKPGQLVYFYTYGQSLTVGDSIKFDLLSPDLRVISILRTRSGSAYNSFYWWQSTTLSNNAPVGNWLFRVTFGQKQYTHPFLVTNDPGNALTLSASKAILQCVNDSVTLHASIPSQGLQWRRNGLPINSLRAGEITVREEGNYTVDLLGTVSAPLALSVNLLPVVKPTVVQNGFTLTSSLPTNNQWTRNGIPIDGATGQTITVTESGTYRVLTKQDCGTGTSDVMEVVILATETIDRRIGILPNPVQADCQITWSPILKPTQLTIASATGQLVHSQSVTGIDQVRVSSQSWSPGTYLVWLQTETTRYVRRMIVAR